MSNSTLSLKGQRILIVDDDADIREMLSVCFAQCGMYVHSSEDARTALTTYAELVRAERRPEYVLLDAALTIRRTGFDVAEEIHKKWDKQNYSTIIMLTAYAKDDLQAPAMEGAIRTGIEEILHKPIDPDILIADIIRIRERHLARKATPGQTIPFPTNRLVAIIAVCLFGLVLGLAAIGFHLQSVENAARRQQQEDWEKAMQNQIMLMDQNVHYRVGDQMAENNRRMDKLDHDLGLEDVYIHSLREEFNHYLGKKGK